MGVPAFPLVCSVVQQALDGLAGPGKDEEHTEAPLAVTAGGVSRWDLWWQRMGSGRQTVPGWDQGKVVDRKHDCSWPQPSWVGMEQRRWASGRALNPITEALKAGEGVGSPS